MKACTIFIKWILLYFTIILEHGSAQFSKQSMLKYIEEFQYMFQMHHDGFKDYSGEDVERELEYDFIVIGGGTAGSVVANRLSEEEGWKVLLLEAGGYESFMTDIPILAPYLEITDYNWGYATEPQEHACWAMEDKRCKLPAGKSLGGSTLINYMIYARGHKLDYDLWAQMGNHGWSYDEVFPYFLKSENFQIPEYKSPKYHSSSGYLSVESCPYRTKLGQAFLDGAKDVGYSVGDYNGEQPLSFSFIEATMQEGSRCSASKAYLKPIQHRTNLHISVNSTVTKVIIDPITKKTTGVEYVKGNVTYRANVTKEVILSAGAINSAQILMLSGIGPVDHLQEMEIPVLQDLKVGYNLQDHIAFYGLTFVINETVGLETAQLKSLHPILQYLTKKTGPLTLPGGLEALGYIRTKYAVDGRPDIEMLMIPGGFNMDITGFSRESIGIQSEFYEKLYKPMRNNVTWMIIPVLLLPKSSGRVRLQDKNPLHRPLSDPKYFTEAQDVACLVEGIKMAISIAESLSLAKYGTKIHSVPVPGCETLTFGSDAYWACAVKYFSSSIHHQAATCKMGPTFDPDAVVDPTLKVIGVKGLRVADMSIIPKMPTAHTSAVAYMIGEKVSDLIKDVWKVDKGLDVVKGVWKKNSQEPKGNGSSSQASSGLPNLLPLPLLIVILNLLVVYCNAY